MNPQPCKGCPQRSVGSLTERKLPLRGVGGRIAFAKGAGGSPRDPPTIRPGQRGPASAGAGCGLILGNYRLIRNIPSPSIPEDHAHDQPRNH